MISGDYDVVIVGAGPAGSTAARVIAKSGLNCLLLDRRKTIGLPVQCGEFLPTSREMRSLFPSSPRAQRLVKVPSSIIRNQCNTLSLVSPHGQEYSFRMEFNVIARDLFDQHIASTAQESGANLLLRANVLGLQGNNVIVKYKKELRKIKARVIIGADGPTSIIAKSIGSGYRNPARDMSYSLQYTMDGISCDSNRCKMYFGSEAAPGGYLWIIPQSSTKANVGFGIRKQFANSLNLSGILDTFIKSKPELGQGNIKKRVGALIPVGGPKKCVESENILLVGDAAGHVMSTNGGGIPTALVGGEIAGETVVSHINNDISLKQYEKTWKLEIGLELYRSLAMLRVADVAMMNDSITEVGMKLAGSKYLEDVIRCRYPKPLEFIGNKLEYFLIRI
jgi:digeranylgeranylglycerophospholipid reductase